MIIRSSFVLLFYRHYRTCFTNTVTHPILLFIYNTNIMAHYHLKIENMATISHYAAGSAIAYINDRLYIAGDNMGHILVLDTSFHEIDNISIGDVPEGLIPKAIKHDIEAATAIHHEGKNALLLISSGSRKKHRDNAWIIDITKRQTIQLSLRPFYDRLKDAGLQKLNIEGAAAIPGGMVLSNRGNNDYPQNHIIITSPTFWTEQDTAPISIKQIVLEHSNATFSGLSGIDYSPLSDCLLLTVSTEDTNNAYLDGAIGKSYLWLVYNFSAKTANDNMVPDHIIDLEAADSRFNRQKIETVCILSESANEMRLALAADNDGGDTVMFEVHITMRPVH
jgi:hypothetical protein